MAFKYLFLLLTPFFLYSEVGYFEPWGKDADLTNNKHQYSMPPQRSTSVAKAAEKIILFHQNYISPLHGSRSNFRPTSSRYMLLSIRRYGFINGYIKGCDRLLRENSDPWVYRTIIIDNKIYKFDPTWQ